MDDLLFRRRPSCFFQFVYKTIWPIFLKFGMHMHHLLDKVNTFHGPVPPSWELSRETAKPKKRNLQIFSFPWDTLQMMEIMNEETSTKMKARLCVSSVKCTDSEAATCSYNEFGDLFVPNL